MRAVLTHLNISTSTFKATQFELFTIEVRKWPLSMPHASGKLYDEVLVYDRPRPQLKMA